MWRFRRRIETKRSAGGRLDDIQPKWSREMLLEIESRWYGNAIQRVNLRPGVKHLIDFFGTSNVPQVVVTDYVGAYKLAALELSVCFSAVYEGESFGFAKPSPKAFEQIAGDFGLPLESILHIGDRVDTDGAAARAAGSQCLILGRDFQSFDSLLKLFPSPRRIHSPPLVIRMCLSSPTFRRARCANNILRVRLGRSKRCLMKQSWRSRGTTAGDATVRCPVT